MRVCIVGAGAIGGLIAAKLSLGGESVSVIDRGLHLLAIQNRGLHLLWNDGNLLKATVEAYQSAVDAGEQDLVVLGTKAYDLEQAAENIAPLLGANTMVMTLQNGIPWWYFQREGGSLDGTRLQSLDPNGILSRRIDAERIIGCVAYPAATLVRPGLVRHIEGDRFPVGELDGAETDRAKSIRDALSRGGLRSRVVTDIRAELWLKALGSLTFNPISALTRATMTAICEFPQTRELVVGMMSEAYAIASKLGITLRHTIEERVQGAEKVGDHKTSMLQDLEARRPLEAEALLGSILELGRLTGTPTPLMGAVYALLDLLDNGNQSSRQKRAPGAAAGMRAA
jgi:ketopantoate reductase